MLVVVDSVEDAAPLPGNIVGEFKSCGCVNPSTDRLALVSRSIHSKVRSSFRANRCTYSSYPIFHLVEVSSILYDQEKIYVINDHSDEIHFHLGQLKVDDANFSRSTKEMIPTTDISRFIDNIQVNYDHTTGTCTKPNTWRNSKIYIDESKHRSFRRIFL